ncbi:MAG: hypothetical protein ACJASX_000102, partial [Limisphaerales bacterium]
PHTRDKLDGLTRVRVLDKVVHFVETFVHGLAA